MADVTASFDRFPMWLRAAILVSACLVLAGLALIPLPGPGLILVIAGLLLAAVAALVRLLTRRP